MSRTAAAKPGRDRASYDHGQLSMRRRAAVLRRALSLGGAAAVLLWSCTSTPAPADSEAAQQTAQHRAPVERGESPPAVEITVPAEVARLPDYESLDPQDDPRQLSFDDLIHGPGSQEFGASKLLREVGVVEMLRDYIINVPPSAEFIAGAEATMASLSTYEFYVGADADGKVMEYFESSMLRFARHAMDTLPFAAASQTLHDAFFEVLEACGRASAWPEVELFEMHNGRGYDIMEHLIEPTFGLTFFEYEQLRHQCARYAATYPTLDPEVRDKLLKSQREHFAEVILRRLDDELPVVEIPPRYQAEIDDLRANGW